MSSPFKLIPVVSIIFKKNNTVLLLRRAFEGTPFDGVYTFVGGHVDGNETIREAAIREAYEEVGAVLTVDDLQFVHVIHSKREIDNQELVWFVFLTERWQGEPYNKEAHKHSEINWFSVNSLPDLLNPRVFISVIDNLCNNSYYSEAGW